MLYAVSTDAGVVIIGGVASAIIGDRQFRPGRQLTEAEATELGAKPVVFVPTDEELAADGFRATGREPTQETAEAFEFGPTDIEPIPAPDLVKWRFDRFLVLSGLATAWDTAETLLRPISRDANNPLSQAASLALYAQEFEFDKTMQLAAALIPSIDPELTIDPEALRPIWIQASQLEA